MIKLIVIVIVVGLLSGCSNFGSGGTITEYVEVEKVVTEYVDRPVTEYVEVEKVVTEYIEIEKEVPVYIDREVIVYTEPVALDLFRLTKIKGWKGTSEYELQFQVVGNYSIAQFEIGIPDTTFAIWGTGNMYIQDNLVQYTSHGGFLPNKVYKIIFQNSNPDLTKADLSYILR